MTTCNTHPFYDSRAAKAIMPLALTLLATVCIAGVCIYPILFSAASHASSVGQLAGKLLITALAAQIAALVPAAICSFKEENFSISMTLVLSLTAAVFVSWLAMLIQQIAPMSSICGLFGSLLNVMCTALIGSVLSVFPAMLATFLCILRRVIVNLIASMRP